MTQEQTEINTLSTLAAVGKDVLAIVKNAAPVEIQAASGLAQLGAAAGFAGFAIATDGATADGQNGSAPQQPTPLTQSQLATIHNGAALSPVDVKPSLKLDANGLTDIERLWASERGDLYESVDYTHQRVATEEVKQAIKTAAGFATFIDESARQAADVWTNTSLSYRDRIIKLQEIGNDLRRYYALYADQLAYAFHYLKHLAPDDPLQVTVAKMSLFLPGAGVFTPPEFAAELAKEIKLYGVASDETGKQLTAFQGHLESLQSVIHRAQAVIGTALIVGGAASTAAEKGFEAGMNRLVLTLAAIKLIDASLNAAGDGARAFGASDQQVNTGLQMASFALMLVVPEEGAEEEAAAGKLGTPRNGIANNPNNIQLKLLGEQGAAEKAAAEAEATAPRDGVGDEIDVGPLTKKIPNPDGRNGGPAHQADVKANNDQTTGLLLPKAIGGRVPDGVGEFGQVVTIRGQTIDPGPNARVIVESEKFTKGGLPVSDGRYQLRDIRAGEPTATIVATDQNNLSAAPVVYPPGTQPPPGTRLPRNTKAIQPYP